MAPGATILRLPPRQASMRIFSTFRALLSTVPTRFCVFTFFVVATLFRICSQIGPSRALLKHPSTSAFCQCQTCNVPNLTSQQIVFSWNFEYYSPSHSAPFFSDVSAIRIRGCANQYLSHHHVFSTWVSHVTTQSTPFSLLKFSTPPGFCGTSTFCYAQLQSCDFWCLPLRLCPKTCFTLSTKSKNCYEIISNDLHLKRFLDTHHLQCQILLWSYP